MNKTPVLVTSAVSGVDNFIPDTRKQRSKRKARKDKARTQKAARRRQRR